MKRLLVLSLFIFVLLLCEKKHDVDFDAAFGDKWQSSTPAQKRCFIWIEGNANFRDYGDSRENIARDMEKIADCGFTDIVVDVRPAGSGGDVLFQTDKCSQVPWLHERLLGLYQRRI